MNLDFDQVNFEPIKQINVTSAYILDTLLTLHTAYTNALTPNVSSELQQVQPRHD